MAAPVRILLSPPTREALAPRIREVLGERAFELVTGPELAQAAAAGQSAEFDLCFISRDITGLSTKHEVTPETAVYYQLLSLCQGLQWVHIHSAGADRPIYTELHGRGVQVCTSSGANAEVVVQTALAGLLALTRHFPALWQAQQQARWAPLTQHPPRDLAGQTAVLVGWGPIGQRLGALLQLLGLNVVVVRQRADQSALLNGQPLRTLATPDLHQVLPEADWLILACPLTPQTRGSIDRQALLAMPANGQLINVARGEVVVEPDLIEVLRQGHLAGVYLDVFAHEPLPADSPLWHMPRVLLTPHSAGHSAGNPARVVDLFLANLARWHAGQPLAHVIG